MSSMRDVALIAVILFTVGIFLLIMNFTTKTMVNAIVAIPAINSSTEASQVFNSTSNLTDRFDYIVLGVFIGLILGVIISGWLIAGNPIFTVFYMIGTIISVIVSMILANTWSDVSQASIFGTTVASFPITNHILNYLPYYIGIIGILGMVIIFSKPYIMNEI